MHEPELGGARCAQACTIMATAMLADRGARLYGSYELTYLANRPADHALDKRFDFRVDGFDDVQTMRVLNECDCRTTAASFAEVIGSTTGGPGMPASGSWSAKLAERLVEAYVLARLPITMFVDPVKWNPDGYRDEDLDEDGHAVTIIGFREKACNAEEIPSWKDAPNELQPTLLTDLIVHDPSLRPFVIVPTDYAFWASTEFQRDDEDNADGVLNLMFVADESIKVHAIERFKELCNQMHAAGGLIDAHVSQYLIKKDEDLRFSLIHRDDVERTYFESLSQIYLTPGADHDQAEEELKRVREEIQEEFPYLLKKQWYWAIGGYRDGELKTLWLCNTKRDSSALDQKGLSPWEWRFDVNDRVAEDGDGIRLMRTDFSNIALARTANRPPVKEKQEPYLELRQQRYFDEPLVPSVITSSSDRPLQSFINEVVAIDRSHVFDLFVLRSRDMEMMADSQHPLLDPENPKEPLPLEKVDEYCAADILATEGNVQRVAGWVAEQFSGPEPLQIAAFATYFPQIVNRSKQGPKYAWVEDEKKWTRTYRETAIAALANTVCLGIELKRKRLKRAEGTEEPLCSDVIIEMVCGSILDTETDSPQITADSDQAKMEFLLESLVKVVEAVKNKRDEDGQAIYADEPWVLALEFEPGETYVLGTPKRLKNLIAMLPEYPELEGHVGLNVDIAHMRMAGIKASDLRDWGCEDWIVHAHIADHPGMHTRDQCIGDWTAVDRIGTEEYEFLTLLAEIKETREGGLPFSNTVALELEGCGRIGWVHNSLTKIRQMCETVRHFG